MAKVILGVTGSVAAIKTPEILSGLRASGHEVQVVATRAATYFFDSKSVAPLHLDANEWPNDRYQRGDPVLHIELRRWADLLLIAPLDANTLAKLAFGLSDNCLTCVWRAWDLTRPVVLAPAMNTLMWESPLTKRHFRLLSECWGIRAPDLPLDGCIDWINSKVATLRILAPVAKQLACGDVGVGAMADVAAIVDACIASVNPGR